MRLHLRLDACVYLEHEWTVVAAGPLACELQRPFEGAQRRVPSGGNAFEAEFVVAQGRDRCQGDPGRLPGHHRLSGRISAGYRKPGRLDVKFSAWADQGHARQDQAENRCRYEKIRVLDLNSPRKEPEGKSLRCSSEPDLEPEAPAQQELRFKVPRQIRPDALRTQGIARLESSLAGPQGPVRFGEAERARGRSNQDRVEDCSWRKGDQAAHVCAKEDPAEDNGRDGHPPAHRLWPGSGERRRHADHSRCGQRLDPRGIEPHLLGLQCFYPGQPVDERHCAEGDPDLAGIQRLDAP